MKYTLEKKDTSVIVKIEITPEEWAKYTDEAFEKNKASYQHAGFRKGHVPRKVMESVYGPRFLDEDALDICFGLYYSEALESDRTIEVIDHPSLNEFRHEDNGSVTVVAQAPIKPEVKLGAYTGLTVEKSDRKVSEEEFMAEMKRIMERYSRMPEVSGRGVEEGDEVTIDYSGKVDGVVFEGGTAENQRLVIGSGRFIPGFEEQLVGMNTGDEKDINVKFPEEYHAEHLKGKDSVFHVKLHKIEKKEVPELTDEFVKDISEFESAEEYRNDVMKRMTADKEKRAETLDENKLVDMIVDNAEVAQSDVLVEKEIDYYLQDFERMLKAQGIKLNDYVKYTGENIQSMRDANRERAVKNVKSQLVIDAIIEKEKLQATDEQIEEQIVSAAKEAAKEPEEYKKDLPQGARGYFARQATVKNFFDFIKANNKFE